jgi:hypothetical protein
VGIWKRAWYESDSFYEDPFPEKGFFVEHPSLGGVFVKSEEVSSAIEIAEEVFEDRKRSRDRQLKSRAIA